MLLNNSWYLDDGILAGTEAELLHSLDILESEGKDLGFNVRTSKCMSSWVDWVQNAQVITI